MKFKYKAKVVVNSGFYEGQKGTILKCAESNQGGGMRYLIKTVDEDEIWVSESELKTLSPKGSENTREN